jgi:hypothetical protein
MPRGASTVLGVYLIWVLFQLGQVVYYISTGSAAAGEVQGGAHMALVVTGLPSSLMSLMLPHGSLAAILLAGVLGIVQWALFIRFVTGHEKG